MTKDKYIQGEYSQTLYHSDTTGFTIALFKVKVVSNEELNDIKYKTISIKGYIPEFSKDETYRLYGELIIHPKYGKQFDVKHYERLVATNEEALVRYLSGGLFSGIGEKTAQSIVDVLGNDAIAKIASDYSCLLEVPKISLQKAQRIHEIIKSYEGSQNVILKLTELGLSLKMAMKIYKQYDYLTLDIIHKNPYQLVEEIEGVSFKIADQIALNNGFNKDDIKRIQAAIVYALVSICYSDGHTYLTKNQIIESTYDFFINDNISNQLIEDALNQLVNSNKIKLDDNGYFHPSLYYAEIGITERLKNILSLDNIKKINEKKIINTIEAIENGLNITFAEKQKEAISKAINSKVLILTGGPGTGKTTTIKGIVNTYAYLNKINLDALGDSNEIAFVAPTGRAAKRISETANVNAMTIHRFLKWNQVTNEFTHNEENPINCKLLIIDEASMIDTYLLYNLLRALNNDVRIILVGDKNQLPSVAPGDILKDLINSTCFEIVELDILYRQSNTSTLIDFAHKVKDGIVPDDFIEVKSDRSFIKTNQENMVEALVEIVRRALNKNYNYDNLQVLVPMYKGPCGIDLINVKLQEVFNPYEVTKRELKFGSVIFREGDKILHLVNNPNENVFNGDIGILHRIQLANESPEKMNIIIVNYDGNLVRYTPSDFNTITHAFAMSIHKAQGSEFKLVIMPLVNSYYRMLQRKLIYTGLTRAKDSLVLIGEPSAFIEGVSKDVALERQTKLEKRLSFEIKGVIPKKIYTLDELGEIGMENISPYDFM